MTVTVTNCGRGSDCDSDCNSDTVLAPKGYLFCDLVNVLEHSILLLSKTFFTEATDMRS